MRIEFAGHELMLHHSGVLYWPEQSLLLVSDLHLEKGSHFAKRHFFLPPYDTAETLSRLWKIVQHFQPKRIALLGDCFHDAQGFMRLCEEDRKLFDALIAFTPIWVRGNHDGSYVPDGFAGVDSYEIEGITLRHEAEDAEGFEISGHYHPKLMIRSVRRDCFICDGKRLILPAFGSYTGGLSVHDPAIACLLEVEKARVYALGEERVHILPWQIEERKRRS